MNDVIAESKTRPELLNATAAIARAPVASGEQWSLGRFAVRERLGQGAMGRVYRVFDPVRGHEVALKLLTAMRPDSLYRFKQEFRALADLVHPNLATLYELHADAGEWCVAMELVADARTFLDYVRPHRHLMAAEGADLEVASSASRSPCNPSENYARGSARSAEITAAPTTTLATVEVDSLQRGGGSQRRRFIESATLNHERLRGALSQLIDGVAALHERGMVHRDLKPSNVLVDRSGRVVICDFGLISPFQADEGQFLGTPAYASPEQSAGMGTLTAASDWYSVGVMLYEALTGRLPLEAPSVRELFACKGSASIAAPRAIDASIPSELDALCMALLEPGPERRPTAIALREALSTSGAAPPLAATIEAPFVGRAKELERLNAAYADARRGSTVTLLVGGPSGTGKTALAARATAELLVGSDAVVFGGRCYEGESVPFKALDAVIDAIAGYLRNQPELARAVVPDEIDALAHLFPTLRRAAAVAERLAGNEPVVHGVSREPLAKQQSLGETPKGAREQQKSAALAPHRGGGFLRHQSRGGGLAASVALIRRRAAVALRTLLARLAQRRPVIVSIDDLQWGDADSAFLLVELAQAAETPGILLLGTFRNDGAAEPALIAALNTQLGAAGATTDVRMLSLLPLPQREVEGLVAAITGEDPGAALVRRLAQESEGNPFFATELAFARGSLTELQGLDALLARRIGILPGPAKRLLAAAALATRPQPIDVLVRAARVRDVAQTLAQLRVERFSRVEQSRDGERLTTYHDRIRETIAAGMEATARRKLHRRLARAFEAAPERDLEALVFHWRGAGEPERARRYAIAAAERALRSQAYSSAATQFAAAVELSPADDPERLALEIAHADALQRAGQLPAAAAAFHAAASRAEVDAAVELRGRAVVCFLRAGRVDEAMAHADAALKATGSSLPRSTIGAVVAILFSRLLLAGRQVIGPEIRLRHDCPAHELRRLDLAMETALGLGFNDTLLGFAMHSRALPAALRAGEPQRAAMAMTYEAVFSAAMRGVPGASACDALLARARQLAVEHAPASYRAIVDGWRGYTSILHYQQLSEGAALMEDNIPAAESELRFAYDTDQLRLGLVNTWTHAGELALVSARLPALLRRAQESGNIYLLNSLRAQGGVYIWLAADAPAEAARNLDAAGPPVAGRPTMAQFYWHVVHADVARYDGRLRDAWALLEPFWRRMRRSSLAKCAIPYAFAAQLVGRTAVGLAIENPAQRSKWLRVAARQARALERYGRKLPYFALAHARAIRAMVAALRGQQQSAVSLLGDAVARFDVAGANFYSMPMRARLGQLVGGDAGAEHSAAYHAWAHREQVRNPTRFAAWMLPALP